jgi:serine/threonine protein kinase
MGLGRGGLRNRCTPPSYNFSIVESELETHASSARLGHYRIGERIGSGGMGVVYKAYDELLDRWVAVKIIPPDKRQDLVRRERLRREARASARLAHPAIVKIYDFLITETADAIVMELVEGVPLSRVLRDGPIDLPRAFTLAREIAEALDEAHSHGIVHRDLKTENVIFTPAGRPKILDFGIAKLAGQIDAALTLEGRVLGTCRAMAPEQAEGHEVDHRADLFTFGVLLYEVLTGHSPFLDSSAAGTLRRVCTERQAPMRAINPWIPPELSDLVDHLLEKEPGRRPRSAREVASRLARIAAEAQLSFALSTDTRTSADETTLPDIRPGSAAVPSPGSAAPERPATNPTPGAAERRQVTVLLCAPIHPDGEPLDPEEMLGGMREMHAAMSRVIERFEGYLGPPREFGWPAYFGYPRAHEDDACRAVRAALRIVDEARAVCPSTGAVIAAMRVGLHTGPMIMARSGSDPLALGDTPNVAALIQGLAPPGAVLISQTTWRLVEGFFDGEELSIPLPLGARPTPLYHVIADRGAYCRFEAGGALASMVARERELGLLLEHWEHASEGRGQVVVLSGEAGIGKSRLVWELKREIASQAGEWLEGHATPEHRHSSLHPVRQIIHQMLGTDGEVEPAGRLEQLEARLAELGISGPEHAPLLAHFLAVSAASAADPRTASTTASSPMVQRRRMLEAVVSLLLAAADRRTLSIVLEDLHWADPSTLELLDLLIQHLANAPILLLLTTRPELQPAWEALSSLTRLTLAPLTRAQARLLVERLTAGRAIEPQWIEQIVARTDGVPLFVEELTRVVQESGMPGGGSLPSSLEGWLSARLDRLDDARELAQIASAIGRELSWELLCEVAPWEEKELTRGLERLVEAEILQRCGLQAKSRYRFKHALLQDAAYASLLRTDRQRLHQQIARILENRLTDLAGDQPELVAHHYTEAGLPEAASIWWQRAGEQAMRASAFREALEHLERSLATLRVLPQSPERDHRELAVQVAYGTAAAALRSYATPEVKQAFARAWELCGPNGQTPVAFAVLRGLYLHALIGGDMASARETTLRILATARQEGEPSLLVTAHQGAGFVRLLRGDLAAARAHLEESLTHGGPVVSPADLLEPGVGIPALNSLANLSWTLWLLGFPEQALRRAREAADLAQKLTVPRLNLCFVEYSLAELGSFRREPAEVERRAEALVPLAADHGFRMFEAMGRFLLAWARNEQGHGGETVAGMRQALTARRELGAHAGLPSHYALLAGAYLRADRIVEGLATLKEALALQGDQRIMEAELHRLKAELLHRHGVSDLEVEGHLEKALDVARHQGARSLELRAATSLARLRIHQGRRSEGGDLLAAVYATFTEGLDTPDLREARAVLELE